MTAASAPCAPDPDRVARAARVPDPPPGPIGRRRYWDDTVFEAIGELRRGLASSRESVSVMALLTIVELEKHKMRHGRPISGTTVPNVTEADDHADPLPKLAPLDPPTVLRSTTGLPTAANPAEFGTDVLKNQMSKSVAPSGPPQPDRPNLAHLTPLERDFAERDAEIDAGLRRVADDVFGPRLDDFARAARPVRARGRPPARSRACTRGHAR